jgi:hypothetical protein
VTVRGEELEQVVEDCPSRSKKENEHSEECLDAGASLHVIQPASQPRQRIQIQAEREAHSLIFI